MDPVLSSGLVKRGQPKIRVVWRLRVALRALALAFVVAVAGLSHPWLVARSFGAGTIASEVELRAALVFKLTWFTTWPADSFSSPDAPLRLCVLGDNLLAEALTATVKGRTTSGRAVRTERVRSPKDAVGCHVLYMGEGVTMRIEETLAGLGGGSTLTVGEGKKFCQHGGMINLVRKGRRFSFAIRPGAAERVGLMFSSRLLKLADIVREQDALGK